VAESNQSPWRSNKKLRREEKGLEVVVVVVGEPTKRGKRMFSGGVTKEIISGNTTTKEAMITANASLAGVER